MNLIKYYLREIRNIFIRKLLIFEKAECQNFRIRILDFKKFGFDPDPSPGSDPDTLNPDPQLWLSREL